MKLRNTILAALLAAATLLAGCKENTGNSDSGNNDSSSNNVNSIVPPSDLSDPDSTNSSNSTDSSNSTVSSTQSGGEDSMGIVSTKPKEIDGFKGNTVEVKPKAGDLIATFEIEGFGTVKALLFPEAAPIGVENFQKLADSGYFKGLTIHRVVKDFMLQGGSLNGDGTGGDALVNGGSFGIETAQNARHFFGALCYANAQGKNSTQFYIVNNKVPQNLSDFDLDSYRGIVEQGKSYIKMAEGNADALSYYTFQTQYYQNTIDWVEGATDEISKLYKEKGGTPFLDGNYTVFGQVYEGFDVIDSISAVEVKDNGSKEVSKPVQTITIKDVTVTEFAE